MSIMKKSKTLETSSLKNLTMSNSNYEKKGISAKKHSNAKSFSNVLDIEEDGTMILKSGQVAFLYSVEAIDISLSSAVEQESFYVQLRNLYLIKGLNLKMYKFDKELDFNSIESKLNYTILEKSNDMKRSILLDDQREILNILKGDAGKKSARYYWVLISDSKPKLSEIAIDVEQTCATLTNPLYITRMDNQLYVKQFLQELYFQENNFSDLLYNDLTDAVVPRCVEETPNYLKIDDKFVQIVSIKKVSQRVYQAYLDGIFNTPLSTSCLMITDGFDTQKFINTLNYNYRSLRTDRMTTKKLSDATELDNQDIAMQQLMNDLTTGNEQLKSFTLLIALYADDEKTLKEIWKNLKSYCTVSAITLDICKYRQLEAWQSFDITTIPFKDYTKPQSTLALAAGFPLTRSFFLDANGFYLGYDCISGLPNYFDPFFLSQTRKNHNIAVVGSSGSGKSFLIKKLLLNEYAKGCKLFILDVENEYGNIVKKNDGHFINLYSRAGGMINPLQIRLLPSDNDDDEDVEFLGGDSPLAKHIGFLESFFYMAFDNLEENQWIVLVQLLEELYANFGITNNTSVSELENKTNTDYPIFTDLVNLLKSKLDQDYGEEKNKIFSQLDILLSRFVHGTDENLFNGHTSIDLNNDIICFNLQELLATQNKRLISTQVVSLLTYLNSIVIANKMKNETSSHKQNIIIAADEFHVFAEYPDILKFLSQLCRRVRKYSGSFLFATQSMQDLLGSGDVIKYARAIFDNCQYTFCGNLSEDDFNAYKNLLQANPLTDTQIHFLRGATLGEFLVTIDTKRRLLVHIDTSNFEQEMMGEKERKTTDH